MVSVCSILMLPAGEAVVACSMTLTQLRFYLNVAKGGRRAEGSTA
jgi:hypothetical protein